MVEKVGYKRSSLLRDAINAVDAALGSDKKQNDQMHDELSDNDSIIKNEQSNAEVVSIHKTHEIIEQALMEMKIQTDTDMPEFNNAKAPEGAGNLVLSENRELVSHEDNSVVNKDENPLSHNPLQGSIDPGRTQRVRVKPQAELPEFFQEPVVAWLVIIEGPGLGAYRPVFEGNNCLGRAPTQHIQINFGDDTISNEEQAYIRYDCQDRSFLFVPNLSKTNVVAVNSRKPTAALPLKAMDIISMGKTRMAFVPFCGKEFDWSDISS